MNYTMIFLLCTLFGFSYDTFGFKSLSQAQQYARLFPEYPQPDYPDLLHPDYSSFFQQHAPTFFHKIGYSLGFFKKPLWYSADFQQNLIALTQQRKNGTRSGRFVEGFVAKPNTKIIIFGDIEGAFHSLVRDLEELKTMGVIDDQLQIIQPDHYIVFVGSVVQRSAYMLETLDLIISLMNRNSEHVFYIKGKSEDHESWSYRGLARQLFFYARTISSEQIPLFNELNAFFQTLPLALYIGCEKELKTNIIRISSYDRSFGELNENKMGSFFKNLASRLSVRNLSTHEQTPEMVHVQALIKSLDRTIFYSPPVALDKLKNEGGADVWSIFSSPTLAHQQLHDFFHDAFALLTIGKTIPECTISLYHRDVRTKNRFSMYKTFQLATISEKNFLIGSSLDLSKSISTIGQHAVDGIWVATKEVNKAGGIHGKALQEIILDDAFMPYKTIQNVDTLKKKYGVNILLLPTGSNNLLSVIDKIRTGEIFVAFPLTGVIKLRQPDLKGVVHLRSSYREEAIALVNYVVQTYKLKKIAFFYQDDEFGIGPLEEAEKELKKYGISSVIKIPYEKNSTEFSKQVDILKNSNAQALGCFSSAMATKEFFYQLGIENLYNIKVFGISPLADSTFMRFIKSVGLPMIFSQVVPDPVRSDLEVVKNYRKAMAAAGISYNTVSLEAYMATHILSDIMNKISTPVTREKLIEFIPTIQQYTYKGLVLNFNPETRSLVDSLWIDAGDGSPWIKVEKKHIVPMAKSDA